MSYAVFAMGALLSLCGALAIYAGYGIIQVERGWAEVIAGSIAFSCGIVTIALGCVLYRLTSLQALLKAKTSVFSYAEKEEGEAAPQPDRSVSTAAEAPVLPETAAAPHAGLRMWPQRAARSSLGSLRSSLKPRGAMAPVRSREPDSPFYRAPHPVTGQPQDQDRKEKETSALPPRPQPPSGAATEEPAPEPANRFEAPQFSAVDEFQSEKLQFAAREPLPAPEEERPQDEAEAGPAPGKPAAGACEETEAEEEPRLAWPAETVALEAILRDEFRLETGAATLESVEQAEEAGRVEEPLPETPSGAAEKAGDEPLSEEPAGGEAALPPDFPPAIEPQVISDERLAIVGRYESEGTSYVMYADGSIEARTQHAVFHFKSMAELKAFMESQAQSPPE
ncbi:MAG TPA: hypothetical protein VFG05_09170 [Methylocella sp.]|nr:hypothetical protein [Methylocella sp.]